MQFNEFLKINKYNYNLFCNKVKLPTEVESHAKFLQKS